MRRLFVSYRRQDSSGHAGRIYDSLLARLGSRVEVFVDVDAIPPGADFGDVIQSAVSGADALLLVIGPRWVDMRDGAGRRRIDDPADFVRLEVAAALSHGVRIVPVLVQGARMPSATELPVDLAPLARREAIELSDERWQFDIGRLAAAVGTAPGRPWYRRPAVLAMATVILASVTVGVPMLVSGQESTGTTGSAGTADIATNASGAIGGEGPTMSLSALLFSDAMVPPDSRWATYETSDTGPACRIASTTAGYTMTITGRDYYCGSLIDFDPVVAQLGDVALEATVRFTEQTLPGDIRGGPGLAGLRCRARGSDSGGDGYSVGVGPAGRYQLDRFLDGQQRKLEEGTDPALRLAFDEGSVDLRLECIGAPGGKTTIRLMRGGSEIVSYVDELGLPAGAPGLDTASFAEPTLGVSFTNVRVFGRG